MLNVEQEKKRSKLWVILMLIVILLVVCFFAWYVNGKSLNFFNQNSKVAENNVIEKQDPKTTAISSNVLFTGNVYWGRYINDWSMASDLKYAYPFSRLNEFNRDSYDAWISGLECPTKTGVNMTSAEEDSTLTFNCSPEYIPEASKWFTAFTLANNHTDNQGPEGLAETKQHLEKNDIQYFGNPDPNVIDDICEVISLPVTVKKDDGSSQAGKLPVAMCGYHAVFQLPTQESVDIISEYSDIMPVIAFPHMGKEYQSTPDDLKINFYRSLIDGGAEMVIGDHPHWIQTSESYNGHLIVYSMGNFIFDQQDTSEVVRSAAVRVVIDSSLNESDLLDKWLELGKTCNIFHDDCLEKAKDQKLSKLDLTYKIGIIGSNDADKIVKPANEEQQASILQRLNWQNTINNLQTPYSSL